MNDLISRTIDENSVIDIVTYECGEWSGLAKEIVKQIKAIPSAERKGHWIHEDDGIIHGRCSNCGWVAVWQSTDVFGMDFCPNCGARMEVDK